MYIEYLQLRDFIGVVLLLKDILKEWHFLGTATTVVLQFTIANLKKMWNVTYHCTIHIDTHP
jgi:hypothetical protein